MFKRIGGRVAIMGGKKEEVERALESMRKSISSLPPNLREKAEKLLKNEELLRKELLIHYGGEIKIAPKEKATEKNLPLYYTPNIALLGTAFECFPELTNKFALRGRTIGVVTDGTRILGLGDIGPYGGLSVMGGKAFLFMDGSRSRINAFPIAVGTKDRDEFIETVVRIAPSFAAINLEDIDSNGGKCFYILEQLRKRLRELPVPVPVWHDDQQGTAAIVTAALKNALKAVGKDIRKVRIILNGAGAANIRIAEYLMMFGAKGENIISLDSKGALYKGRKDLELTENGHARSLAEKTNPEKRKGRLADVIGGSDVLISATSPEAVQKFVRRDIVRKMNKNPIVFILENPTPRETLKEVAKGGAAVIANGSFPPNQCNNMYVFPGLMWGTISVHAKEINDEMVRATVDAIAGMVERPRRERILPAITPEVHLRVGVSVAKAAIESGVAGVDVKLPADERKAFRMLERMLKN